MRATAATQSPIGARRTLSHPLYINESLSPKKTAFVIVTVMGCVAILWPKVFYPLMSGSSVSKVDMKEQRIAGGLRQERPAHLHPESIYQAMRERGRAIPVTPTIPIIDKKASASNPPPRIVEGRPGPIPGMRPPMGAGSVHQPQTKGSSMSLVMPLYTIGIIVFFVYTILKIVFKKSTPNAPYGPAPINANFRKEVFGEDTDGTHTSSNNSKLGPNYGNQNELNGTSLSSSIGLNKLTPSLNDYQSHQHRYQHQQEQQLSSSYPADAAHISPTILDKLSNKESNQLMEIERLRKKLEQTQNEMAKLIAEMNSDQYDTKKQPPENVSSRVDDNAQQHSEHHDAENVRRDLNDSQNNALDEQKKNVEQRKHRGGSADRSVEILGIEVTASCEGGQKWIGRPPTPIFFSHSEHSNDATLPDNQAIFLKGNVARDAKILVSDSETKTEQIYNEENNGSTEEPAVVLSSRMTLSLVNLDATNLDGINSLEDKMDTGGPPEDGAKAIVQNEE